MKPDQHTPADARPASGAAARPQDASAARGAQPDQARRPAASPDTAPTGKGGPAPAPRDAARAGRAPAPDRVKVLPPESPVDVPRQPAPASPGAADEAGVQSDPPADVQTESNWADGSRPQPRAKNARSSLF